MGRQARKISSSGFYYVMFRGVNHQHLFEEDSDYEKFLWDLANERKRRIIYSSN